MTRTRSPSTDAKAHSVTRRIDFFRKRFGDGHFYLACHAALPIALTSDLLYSLWANFQRDTQGAAIEIPWIAVADLMLSNLCKEVGHELYEMDGAVRDELLFQLQQDSRFGQDRIRELADFLMAYIEQQFDSPDLDVRDLATSQRWRALAYKNPSEAAHNIAFALANLPLNDKAEWIRMAALVNSLAKPLSAFQSLLNYVQAMANLARGNLEAATTQMAKAVDANTQVQIEGVSLPIPSVIDGKLPQSTRKDKPAIPPFKRFVVPTAIAVGTIMPLLALLAMQDRLRSPTPQSTAVSSGTPTPKNSRSSTPIPQPSAQVSPAPSPTSSQSVTPQQTLGASNAPAKSQPQATRSPTSSQATGSSVTTTSSNSQSSAIPSDSSIQSLSNPSQSPGPQSSTAPSPSVLQFGDTGPAVLDLQRQLAQLGYDVGPIDGVFGSALEDAVRKFQLNSGMAIDGVAGPELFSALHPSSIESPTPPSTPLPESSSSPSSQPSTIPVTRIDVVGSTVLSNRELRAITQPVEGSSVTFEELRGVADAITQLYLNRGYVTSRAYITDQTVTNGVVIIQVVEGSLERIDIEGTQNVDPNYIRQIVERGVSVPLNQNDLEAQLRLLQSDTRFTNVEASLNPGTQLGQSILVIRVTEANSSGTLRFSPRDPSLPARSQGGARR